MINIKEIVSKKGKYAFLCKNRKNFKMCIKQAFDEGIVFSNTNHHHLLYSLDWDPTYLLMVNNGYEIKLYSRDIYNSYLYNSYGFDWEEWEIIDWTILMRESKIDEILK
jgi:hypothetical protein